MFSTERSLKIKELEKLIMVERRHLEAAEKMAAPLMNSASNAVRRNWKSAVEVQMDSSKQRLANLQAELDKLNSVRVGREWLQHTGARERSKIITLLCFVIFFLT